MQKSENSNSNRIPETEIPQGVWGERLPNGERVVCFKIRVHGKSKKIQLTQELFAKIIKQT